MEPVFPITAGVSLLVKTWTRSKVRKWEDARNAAAREYRNSLEAEKRERSLCIALCNNLAADQQAAAGAHYYRIMALVRSCGLEDFLGSGEEIFHGRSLEEVRRMVDASQSLLILNPATFGGAGDIAVGTAVMLRGLEWADRVGLAQLPLLTTSLHDVVASLPLAHAGGVADTLGAVGMVDVGTAVADGFMIFSVFSAVGNLVKAKDVAQEVTKYRDETHSLDRKRSAMAGKRLQVANSTELLQSASYELFTWTVVAEEEVRLQEAGRGKAKSKPTLPSWVVQGLRRKTTELWAVLQRPAFN